MRRMWIDRGVAIAIFLMEIGMLMSAHQDVDALHATCEWEIGMWLIVEIFSEIMGLLIHMFNMKERLDTIRFQMTGTAIKTDMGMTETARVRKWDTTVKGGSATGDTVNGDSVEEIRKGIINNDLTCSE